MVARGEERLAKDWWEEREDGGGGEAEGGFRGDSGGMNVSLKGSCCKVLAIRLLVDVLTAWSGGAGECYLRQATWDGVWVQVGEPFARGGEVFV